MVELLINGEKVEAEVENDTPLLWVLRDSLDMSGTKFGCGVGACGACTVHIDGVATRACSIAVEDVVGARITTIEGLGSGRTTAVQQAWIDEQVPQCGYCQPGMIMAVSAFLAENPDPSDNEIDEAITNICRCGTYPKIRKAIHRAAKSAGGS